MLIAKYISHLIAYDFGIANHRINICMRMAINPCIYATISNDEKQQ